MKPLLITAQLILIALAALAECCVFLNLAMGEAAIAVLLQVMVFIFCFGAGFVKANTERSEASATARPQRPLSDSERMARG